ncbi:MAG: alpha/beta fold hydrolase, partial [Flammeovirgaceae bacterium]
TFNAWVEELKPHFRIIRPDLPGFGISNNTVDHSYGISAYTDFLKKFLDILDIDSCYLAGSSLGGWISWEFTLRYPEQIKRLILVDAAGFMEIDAVPLPFKMARTPIVGRIIKYVVRKTVLEQFLRQVYYNKSKVTEELVDRYYDLFSREGNPEAFLSLVNGRFKDNTRKLKYISAPTLIIWGENDEWIPVKFAHKFHKKIPNSRLVIYEHVGHIPMEEVPKMTAQDVLEFLGVIKSESAAA